MEGARYMAVSSAGTRGAAYLGVIDALEDHLAAKTGTTYDAWRRQIVGVAGTSAGAIAVLFFALGLPRAVRHALVAELTDLRALLRKPDIGLLLQNFGLEDGTAFKRVVQRALESGGMSAHSTLGDLSRLLRIDFVCMATDLQTGSAVPLSAANYPDMRVADAVYASCCVPFLFAPQRVGGALAVDGCLSCALPEVFDEAKTLFMYVDAPRNESPCTNWTTFLHTIVQCASHAQSHRIAGLHERNANVLRVCFPSTLASQTPALDPNLTPVALAHLVHWGYVVALDSLHGGAVTCGVNVATTHYVALMAAVRVLSAAEAEEAPPDHDVGPHECPPGG